MIELLRWLPRNSSKIYPKLSPAEIAAKSREAGRTDLISAANIDTYLTKLCGELNWAMREQFIDRNPAVDLKVPDPVLRREKRLPFRLHQTVRQRCRGSRTSLTICVWVNPVTSRTRATSSERAVMRHSLAR